MAVYYTEEHEWIRVDGDQATVGITDFAQGQLGDIVFVELPEEGATLEAGDSFGTVESVKAVSDLYSPVGGEVVEVNEALNDNPEKINEDPYGDGWICLIEPTDGAELDGLLDGAAYRAHIDG